MHNLKKSVNRIHLLQDITVAFCISAIITIIISAAFFELPKKSIYTPPRTKTIVFSQPEEKVELEVETIVEQVKLDGCNINDWILENIDSSVKFYTEQITNDSQVSRAIINNSIKNKVPVNLAFSVAYKESRYNKNAYNNNGTSKDRGLFQLNDSYRKNWRIDDFYDIDKNSYEGTRYLKEMMKLNDNNITNALYCYNAGPTKVRRYGIIPTRTITYATEILQYEQELNTKFNTWMLN